MTQETDKLDSEQALRLFDTVTYTGVGWTIPAPAQNPPRREWVGLTNGQRMELEYTPSGVKRTAIEMAFAVEAALKEKNT